MGIAGHRCVLIPDAELWEGLPTIQLSAVSDLMFAKATSGIGSPTFVSEKPASLVYSVHQNGGLLVLAYPHASEIARVELEIDHYVIDHFVSSNELAGAAGLARVKKHFRLFRELCFYSQADYLPSAKAGRFLYRLRKRSDRYRRIYRSFDEQKKAEVETDLTIGAGLAGGLIASTILPLFKEVGAEQVHVAEEIRKVCLDVAPSRLQQCLDGRSYSLHEFASSILSTRSVLMLAIVFLVYVVYKMKRTLET